MADRKVRRMSPTAVKTYMMLLHEAYFCSTRPYLPDDEEDLYLMAYCENREEWASVREDVLGMFEPKTVNGVKVLSNKRLERDWEHLQEIREMRSEAGRKGGLAKAKQKLDSTKQNVASKEVSKEVSEEKEESNTDSLPLEDDGQGDDMNLKTFKAEMTSVGARQGVAVKGYDNIWDDLKILAVAHGYQTVVNDFEEYLSENSGNEYPKGALQSYSWTAADRLRSDSPVQASAKDPGVVSLVRELSYLSDGQISFMDKQRVRLAEVLKEFSAAEIKSVFSAWLADQDTSDPKNLSFLPGKFVQIVDGLAYAARKKKQESEQAKVARDLTAKRLQEEAEAERVQREVEKSKEAELFDPLA